MIYVSVDYLWKVSLYFIFSNYILFLIVRNSEESYCENKMKNKKYSFRKSKRTILKKFLFLKSIGFEVFPLFDIFSFKLIYIYRACNGVLAALKLFNPAVLKRPQLLNLHPPAFKPTSDWKQKIWRCEANTQTSSPT